MTFASDTYQSITEYTHEITLSLVIPFYNEEANVAPLLERVHFALKDLPCPWEVLLVDDGSTDATHAVMQAQRNVYGLHIRVITLQRNFGQTAAMQAGIDYARGHVIATLDGDLQNDPADIPVMLQSMLEKDLDMLAGWRKDRQDDLWRRKIPSRIANRLIRSITGVNLHDYGCSLKLFRADILKGVRLYGEMHRFIPAWFATQTCPARIGEHVVRHHPRHSGNSKYGINRTLRVILDLIAVYFFMRYRARPGHFFGSIGVFFGMIGGMILTYLFTLKVFWGESIGTRPLLIVGVMCVLVAVQLLTTGILSELMARTYFESGQIRSYVVRHSHLSTLEPVWFSEQNRHEKDKPSA